MHQGAGPLRQADRRIRASLLELTHCSSGEMAARVARLLGFIISPDSLLPLQRLEKFPFFPPRIWGVDGFALRKVRTSGTPVVDLERRCPIGLSEGISAQDLTQWLLGPSTGGRVGQGPGLGYRRAGQTALPKAQQVADRFHLVQNVGNTLKDFLHSKRWNMPEALGGSAAAKWWRTVSGFYRQEARHEPRDGQQAPGRGPASGICRPATGLVRSAALFVLSAAKMDPGAPEC